VGLNTALELQPDLIMLDMSMPRMTGLEMLEALRNKDCQVPVIFMTMYGSESIAVEAFRLGVRDYLSKPFSLDEAQDAVNRALRETRLGREKEQLSQNLLAAETVHQTIVTLSHFLNNYLMVADGGLHLLVEALDQEQKDDPRLSQIIADSLASTEKIGAVLQVLHKISDVKLEDYAKGVKMIDIKTAVQEELSKRKADRMQLRESS